MQPKILLVLHFQHVVARHPSEVFYRSALDFFQVSAWPEGINWILAGPVLFIYLIYLFLYTYNYVLLSLLCPASFFLIISYKLKTNIVRLLALLCSDQYSERIK